MRERRQGGVSGRMVSRERVLFYGAGGFLQGLLTHPKLHAAPLTLGRSPVERPLPEAPRGGREAGTAIHTGHPPALRFSPPGSLLGPWGQAAVGFSAGRVRWPGAGTVAGEAIRAGLLGSQRPPAGSRVGFGSFAGGGDVKRGRESALSRGRRCGLRRHSLRSPQVRLQEPGKSHAWAPLTP